MKISFYGHSCVGVHVNGKHLLFDPFITPNELAATVDINSIPADWIICTHGHADHMADLKTIYDKTQALLLSNYEIVNWFAAQGVENSFALNTGGSYQENGLRLKCFQALHSSTLPDGSAGGDPNGYIVYSEEGNFYHAGDTGLMMDMKLLADERLKFAFLPIGGVFTMDIHDAIKAATFINCDKIIGIHYDTFPPINIDKEQAKAAFAAAGKELILLGVGDSIEL